LQLMKTRFYNNLA